jgi:outer membrane protein OmpA-like peptidoglycan-associated protein
MPTFWPLMMDRHTMKQFNSDEAAIAKRAQPRARSRFVTVLLALLASPCLYAAPTGAQREIAGKIAIDAAKPVESVTSAPPSVATTPPARFTPTATSDKAMPLQLDTEFASAKRVVPFAFNKIGVGPRGTLAVRELLPLAKQADRVYVRGRTDGTGATPANRKVAHDRAYTVFKAFRNGGVERRKLRLTYCTNCLVASNDTEQGRKLNRRVEVELVMPRDQIARLPKPVHALPSLPPIPLATSTSLTTPPG